MTLYEWLGTVASALNDNEPGNTFHRYPFKDYLAAYQAAMSIVYLHRGEDFIELVKVKLRPGLHQDARQCCSNVLSILEQIDAKGNILKRLGATEKAAKNKWRKPSCLLDGTGAVVAGTTSYRMTHAMVDAQMNGQFTIEPPVPCDTDAYVLVKCKRKLDLLTEDDAKNLPFDSTSVHATAAWHYVLARMLSGDRHAGSADGTSTIHYKLFLELLGITLKMEDLIENPKK